MNDSDIEAVFQRHIVKLSAEFLSELPSLLWHGWVVLLEPQNVLLWYAQIFLWRKTLLTKEKESRNLVAFNAWKASEGIVQDQKNKGWASWMQTQSRPGILSCAQSGRVAWRLRSHYFLIAWLAPREGARSVYMLVKEWPMPEVWEALLKKPKVLTESI